MNTIGRGALLLAVALVFGGVARGDGDPTAAERQYRIARRLVAEDSPEARSAMRKVLRLDPEGPRADDALVELARLIGVPGSPERLGRLLARQVEESSDLLRRVRKDADRQRAAESRYLLALLHLEPLPGHDPSAARSGLLAVATEHPATDWSAPARYALGWLHEQQGAGERAEATYQRLIVDLPPEDPTAALARVGHARLLLRSGEFGRAAAWLEEAVLVGVAPESRAEPLRELSMRGLLGPSVVAAARGRRNPVGARGLVGFAVGPDGSAWVAARKDSRVVRIDPRGQRLDEWSVEDLSALALDSNGRAIAAAQGMLLRLDAGGRTSVVASLGEMGTVDSLALDGLGGLFILDRRGAIARLDPGASKPRPYWEDRSLKLTSLVWDGRFLIAVDARNRRLVAILRDGSLRSVLQGALLKPVDVSVDSAGRIAVLDTRAGFVFFVTADGRTEEAYPYLAASVEQPAAVSLGTDGALHLLDAESGIWFRAP